MGRWKQYARTILVPIATVLVSLSLRYLFDPLLHDDDAPFLLLLASVMASAYLAGAWAGLLATALGLALTTRFIFPGNQPGLSATIAGFEAAAFVIEALVITLLCHALHRARSRAEQGAQEAVILQREVSDAADREQRRIGQDLHDDLGQYLTGIALSGELLARRMQKENSPHTSDCRKLVHMVNDSVNRTRQLARGLSPMAVDPDSLPLLLAELQERTAELSGKSIVFDTTGTPTDVPHHAVLHLYRIAQEAVSNAVKHANASTVEIELECAPERIRLSVTDNGTGLPSPGATPATAPARAGMGLRVMQFRARTIGARLDISPRTQGSGTAVVLELDVPSPADGPVLSPPSHTTPQPFASSEPVRA